MIDVALGGNEVMIGLPEAWYPILIQKERIGKMKLLVVCETNYMVNFFRDVKTLLRTW